jgi:hypothetical protein
MKLFNKYLMINIPIAFILIVGFMMNVLQPLFVDVSYITPLIFGITVSTMLYIGWVFWKIDNKQTLETFSDFVPQNLDDHIEKLLQPMQLPIYVEELVIVLGFLGTIVGIFVGFQHFPEGAFTDPEKMQEFVRMMLTGFSIEIHAVLMGLVCRIWISILVFLHRQKIRESILD